MITTALMKRSLAVAMLALGMGQAQASTFDLSLNGTVSQGQFYGSDVKDAHYEQWYLSLTGLDASNAFDVWNGDTVNVTITLDQSFTVPASVNLTFVQFNLSGSSFPAIDTGTAGTISFFNGSVAGASGPSDCTSSRQFANCIVFRPPDNGDFTFDKLTASFTIAALAQPVTLDNAQLAYTLFSPAIPEPETYALMLAGLGLLGLAARRRKNVPG